MKNKASKLAFTLYELIIAMALSIIVIGCVASFIVFITNYTAKNEDSYELVNGMADLRREIDYWFSAMDGYSDNNYVDYELKTSSTNQGYYAWFGTDTNYADTEYHIKSETTGEDDGCKFYFISPVREITISLPINCILIFQETTADNYTYTAPSSGEIKLSFTVNMPVSDAKYLCEVVYVE